VTGVTAYIPSTKNGGDGARIITSTGVAPGKKQIWSDGHPARLSRGAGNSIMTKLGESNANFALNRKAVLQRPKKSVRGRMDGAENAALGHFQNFTNSS
jgi:hypothetical protein